MNVENLINEISQSAQDSDIAVKQKVILPEQIGQFSPIPAGLDSKVFDHLTAEFPEGIYGHQAEAIQAVLDGEDVCLATATASGKSLIFMAAAADLGLTSPNATVLALYPVKALIQDQVVKWNSMVKPLGLSCGYIDGSVPTADRPNILRTDRVILMTPDVLQSWLMGNSRKKEIADFLKNLSLLILDEAHVYSGVFGSNMAYLMRRLQAISGLEQIITSTATIGEPGEFIERLTGRRPKVFSEVDDTAPKPPRAVLLCSTEGDEFTNLVRFVADLSKKDIGKLIAFGDSRRLVEMFVAAANRHRESESADVDMDHDAEFDDSVFETLQEANVLPYRAGYEEADRKGIQSALENGQLQGVVATSGLELGIDIGDISTVILLGTPPTVQAFRQRLGRVGRRNPGVCILVDTKGLISTQEGGLAAYLERQPEKGWLYLDNKYIQYTNALCAASEALTSAEFKTDPYKTLPAPFVSMVKNELEPTETLPQDLFPLKQRAQNGPHFEFPVRNGIEKNFSVRLRQGPNIYGLGNLSHSQMLREGYPGAVYYYMARPHRVNYVNFRQGEIDVKRERFFTTKPISQNMVFPRFPNGALSLKKSTIGFVAEAELQVSERVVGFTETRGSSRNVHMYQQGSPFGEKPLVRMFETTGVCWSIPNTQLMTEEVASAILAGFCLKYGIHSRDVGIGTFHANVSPLGGNNCRGICIYDATNGSLRLTEQLADNFGDVLESSIELMMNQEDIDRDLVFTIAHLKECYTEMNTAPFGLVPNIPAPPTETQEWIEVFAVGERVLYKNGSGDVKEMFVHGYRYTPVGLMYEIGAGEKGERCSTKASEVLAADDSIKTVSYNLYTGDIRKQ